jgi:hypothetical protein
MITITITTVPHDRQRYPTVGDWVFDKDNVLSVRVSEMGNPNYEFLVALHELIEAWLCREKGITTSQVDTFDLAFVGDGEPGDDPSSPYHEMHQLATQIEERVANALDIDWQLYDTTLARLGEGKE